MSANDGPPRDSARRGEPPDDLSARLSRLPPVSDGAARVEPAGPHVPPLRVRGYTLTREISRGGQAVIFQAVQDSTGRKVAVRVLREPPDPRVLGLGAYDSAITFKEARLRMLSGEAKLVRSQPEPNTLTDAERAEGWRLLFDGETLTGWHPWEGKEDPGHWAVRDGCLVGSNMPRERESWLATDQEFGDFELRVQWKMIEETTSGVFYRADEQGDPVAAPAYQVERYACGDLSCVIPGADRIVYLDGWNGTVIRCTGTKVEHWLNGKKQVEYDVDSAAFKQAAQDFRAKHPGYPGGASGRIALMIQQGEVSFRNIKICPLPAAPAPVQSPAPATPVASPGQ